MVSPEQSNASGPAPAHLYGLPSCARAYAMARPAADVFTGGGAVAVVGEGLAGGAAERAEGDELEGDGDAARAGGAGELVGSADGDRLAVGAWVAVGGGALGADRAGVLVTVPVGALAGVPAGVAAVAGPAGIAGSVAVGSVAVGSVAVGSAAVGSAAVVRS